jgi:hypothetical protein
MAGAGSRMVAMTEEGMPSELDLFLLPLTTKQYEWADWSVYQPRAPIVGTDMIDFIIEPIADQYINLSRSKLFVQGKFVNGESGEDLGAAEMCAPVNLLFHALWRQVDISLNDKPVNSGSPTYPYIAYLEKMANFSDEAKKTNLQGAFYYEDTAGQFSDVSFTTAVNPGGHKRRALTSSSKSIQMSDKLHHPLFHLNRNIIGNVKVHIKLMRSPAAFYTMRAEKSLTGAPVGTSTIATQANSSPVYFKLESAKLKVFKYRPINNILTAQASVMLKTPAKYVINKVEAKVLNMSSGYMAVNFDNVFLGNIPTRVIMFMVDVGAYEGDYVKNPFEFKHNGLNYLVLYKNGAPCPAQPYQPDFTNDKFLDCWDDMQQCLELWNSNKTNGITLEKYKGGFTFFAWDLSPEKAGSASNFSVLQQGTLNIEVKFREALTTNVNLFVYGETKQLVEIDFQGNVAVD